MFFIWVYLSRVGETRKRKIRKAGSNVSNLHEDSLNRQTYRLYPSLREIRAVAVGADQLFDYAEWAHRSRPRKLQFLRLRHRAYCARLLREIERAAPNKRSRTERAA